MTTDKRSLILNCIRLGMDFYTSALSASCSNEEIEELENDETFQRTIEINKAIMEKDLLEDHEKIIDDCVDKGIAAPLQWKLERINPSQWGSRTKVDTDKPLVGTVTVNLIKATEQDKVG